MAKIYDVNGNKMNVAGVCAELQDAMTTEQKELLAKSVGKYEFENDQMKLAHGILDIYKNIDSDEQGTRVRKLLDYIMTRYQKSTPANAEDQAVYRNFINEISK